MPRIEIIQIAVDPAKYEVRLELVDRAGREIRDTLYLDAPRLARGLDAIRRRHIGRSIVTKNGIGFKWTLLAVTDDDVLNFHFEAL